MINIWLFKGSAQIPLGIKAESYSHGYVEDLIFVSVMSDSGSGFGLKSFKTGSRLGFTRICYSCE